MQELLDQLPHPYLVLFPIYYLITIAIETPILCVGLSSEHPLRRRLLSGIWLTACTYPLVWFVAPVWFDPIEERIAYLAVAESIAHFGECALFYLAFQPRLHPWRDMAAVFGANLASFGLGEWANYLWFANGST
jgi:hypothetical protein